MNMPELQRTSNGVKEIKNINKKSLARITALIYGLVGFFIALAVAISTMANIMMQKDFQGSVILVTLFNVGAGLLIGVLTALLTAALGWIMGYLEAIIYNWFAGKVGGVKVEFLEAGEIAKEETKIQHYFKF
ncbi:MAG: hypothetical protein UU95_C0002G0042 [Parcubacteria group bacterium GW2011_GWC2_42_12]|uniref:DUF3566 domain-containing protein n=2 Tax=Candidatus Falkowiibacteriota TaxID=1752728 RepID=A0A0G0URS8_9BACT|nr:MAG: hypothetical protein UU43_C0005G0020 [Candidatus Falkowbacteria bacterium GW2011_GWA2_41_14]KKS35336.1 MAG: hypothetical protein UU95_C0002G0042 [Parcubacteria group bacterium GW2011_GWC2_42_12]